jgi:hypothetical protein
MSIAAHISSGKWHTESICCQSYLAKSNKRRIKVAKNIRSMLLLAKRGCPSKKSDNKLSVPINL